MNYNGRAIVVWWHPSVWVPVTAQLYWHAWTITSIYLNGRSIYAYFFKVLIPVFLKIGYPHLKIIKSFYYLECHRTRVNFKFGFFEGGRAFYIFRMCRKIIMISKCWCKLIMLNVIDLFQHVDLENAFLCGYLKIKGLTEEYPTLTTFFDGEIISKKFPFLTRKWDADEDVDRKHWVSFKHLYIRALARILKWVSKIELYLFCLMIRCPVSIISILNSEILLCPKSE